MSKLLTVYLTTYNRKDYIKEAIDAILAQTYRDFDLVILDNASTDGTSEIIDGYSDPRITHIRREENIGSVRNVWYAFENAPTRYFIATHDDDEMLPDMLERQVSYMEAHPDIAICDVGVAFVNGEGKSVVDYDLTLRTAEATVYDEDELFVKMYEEGFTLSCPTVMLRTDFIRERGIKPREEAGMSNDRCLYCEINLKGGKVARLKDILYKYRIHGSQETFTTFALGAGGRSFVLEDAIYSLLVSLGKESLKKYIGLGVNSRLTAIGVQAARKLVDKSGYKKLVAEAKSLPYYTVPKAKQKMIIWFSLHMPFVPRFAYFVVKKVFRRKSDYAKTLESNVKEEKK